jgi:hypothetical protein
MAYVAYRAFNGPFDPEIVGFDIFHDYFRDLRTKLRHIGMF